MVPTAEATLAAEGGSARGKSTRSGVSRGFGRMTTEPSDDGQGRGGMRSRAGVSSSTPGHSLAVGLLWPAIR